MSENSGGIRTLASLAPLPSPPPAGGRHLGAREHEPRPAKGVGVRTGAGAGRKGRNGLRREITANGHRDDGGHDTNAEGMTGPPVAGSGASRPEPSPSPSGQLPPTPCAGGDPQPSIPHLFPRASTPCTPGGRAAAAARKRQSPRCGRLSRRPRRAMAGEWGRGPASGGSMGRSPRGDPPSGGAPVPGARASAVAAGPRRGLPPGAARPVPTTARTDETRRTARRWGHRPRDRQGARRRIDI